MFGFFNYETLTQSALKIKESYNLKDPFPHCVLDYAANHWLLDTVLSSFPDPKDLTWWKYDNFFEKKLAFDKVHLLPDAIKKILTEMNSAPFLEFLETITGIEGLIPDPHFSGGGLHQITKGGKLAIHADFNKLKRFNLDRRINVILYLNKDWLDEYGGYLELWDTKMEKCVHKILPSFNRMVIFNTTDNSYHGHPDPLNCPEDRYRRSLALYYYTNGRPEEEKTTPHSTLYQLRPQDPKTAEIIDLKERRGKGRI